MHKGLETTRERVFSSSKFPPQKQNQETASTQYAGDNTDRHFIGRDDDSRQYITQQQERASGKADQDQIIFQMIPEDHADHIWDNDP